MQCFNNMTPTPPTLGLSNNANAPLSHFEGSPNSHHGLLEYSLECKCSEVSNRSRPAEVSCLWLRHASRQSACPPGLILAPFRNLNPDPDTLVLQLGSREPGEPPVLVEVFFNHQGTVYHLSLHRENLPFCWACCRIKAISNDYIIVYHIYIYDYDYSFDILYHIILYIYICVCAYHVCFISYV